MPTRPPLPPEVVELRARFLVGGLTSSIGFHLWNPGLGALGLPELEDVLSAFLLNCLADLSDVMHAGVSLSTCTATCQGITAVSGFDFFSGTWTGGQAQGVTVGWHWIDGSGRRGSAAITHLPACPDEFVDENVRLSHTGYANLRDHGSSLLDQLALLPNGLGGHLVPCIVHRKQQGAYLLVPEIREIVGVLPMLAASTIGRRMSKTRGFSSA